MQSAERKGAVFCVLQGTRALCSFAWNRYPVSHGLTDRRHYVCVRSRNDPAWVDLDAQALILGGVSL